MPVPAGTRMNWTDTSDKKLLLLILQQFPSHSANFDDVAISMAANTTAEACRKRLLKIKKEVAASSTDSATAANTPLKRRGTKQATSESANKRKAKASTVSDSSDPAGEDDDEESPLKKPKYQSIKSEYQLDEYDDELL